MLIEFTVGNFFSFKEKVSFSMIGANSVKEFDETHVNKDIFDKYKILKSAVLYGANGSGKSNLIKALNFMKNFIVTSYRETLSEENSSLNNQSPNNFLLSGELDNAPSFFEIIFNTSDKRYRYGFEIFQNKIISEWLFVLQNKHEKELYSRENQKIIIKKNNFKEGRGVENKVAENVLFLSVVAHLNGEISREIVNWFINSLKIISGLHDHSYNKFTINKLKTDSQFKKWVIKLIKFLDVDDLTIEEVPIESIDYSKLPDDKELKELVGTLKKLQFKTDGFNDKIITWHQKFDTEKNPQVMVPFDFNKQESEGTKKFIYFLGPLYDAFMNGKVLFVDEFDSRFHTLLSIKILEVFHNSKYKNSQLIITSHDTNLLKKELFRRDQIWFTEKNLFGGTELYSLIEYKENKVRNDASFSKNYLSGKYGAIPYFGNFEELVNFIYEEK
jgi:AAA15 family ATPase/GTPase